MKIKSAEDQYTETMKKPPQDCLVGSSYCHGYNAAVKNTLEAVLAEGGIEFYATKADFFEGYDLCDDFSNVVLSANVEGELLGKRARSLKAKINAILEELK